MMIIAILFFASLVKGHAGCDEALREVSAIDKLFHGDLSTASELLNTQVQSYSLYLAECSTVFGGEDCKGFSDWAAASDKQIPPAEIAKSAGVFKNTEQANAALEALSQGCSASTIGCDGLADQTAAFKSRVEDRAKTLAHSKEALVMDYEAFSSAFSGNDRLPSYTQDEFSTRVGFDHLASFQQQELKRLELLLVDFADLKFHCDEGIPLSAGDTEALAASAASAASAPSADVLSSPAPSTGVIVFVVLSSFAVFVGLVWNRKGRPYDGLP